MKLKIDTNHQTAAVALPPAGRFTLRHRNESETLVFVGGLMSFGRSYGQLVMPDDPEISRSHGVIFEDSGRLFLQDDANVANPTMVDGKPAPPGKPVQVELGATVAIGLYVFKVEAAPLAHGGRAVREDATRDSRPSAAPKGARAALLLMAALALIGYYGYTITYGSGSSLPERLPATRPAPRPPPQPALELPSEPAPGLEPEPVAETVFEPEAMPETALEPASEPEPEVESAPQATPKPKPARSPTKKKKMKRKSASEGLPLKLPPKRSKPSRGRD